MNDIIKLTKIYSIQVICPSHCVQGSSICWNQGESKTVIVSFSEFLISVQNAFVFVMQVWL